MGFEIKCLPTFQQVNCCCCQCALKTGTIIIGILEVISGISEASHGLVGLITFDGKDIPVQYKQHDQNPQNLVAYQATFIAEILFGIFAVLIGAAVIYAATKEKANILEPILKLGLVCQVLALVFGIFLSIKAFIENPIVGAVIAVTVVIAIGISFLLWLVIYSYYRQLEEQSYPQRSNYPHNVPEAGKLNDPEQGI